MEKNLYNTDTKALEARENQNKKAKYNLEEWMVKIIDPKKGMDLLDIGCGRGKQIFVFEKYISPGGSIIGLDASWDAVDTVKEITKQKELKNVKAVNGLIDDIPEIFAGKKFDIIMSTYAIYYSQNLNHLLISLKQLLKKDGQIFVCGNGKGSNDEVINLMEEAGSNPERIVDFISEEDINYVGKSYKSYEVFTLNNNVTFKSEMDFLSWWRNHNMYDPALDSLMCERINKIFVKYGKFDVSKNVLGVKFVV